MINKTGDLFQSASVQPVPTPKRHKGRTPLKNMLHQRVNLWTVIGGPRVRHVGDAKYTEWLCCCDCGTEHWFRGTDLRWRPSPDCGGSAHPKRPGRPRGVHKTKEKQRQKTERRVVVSAPATNKIPTPEELKYWRQFAVSQCVRCRKETSIPLRHELLCNAASAPRSTQATAIPPAILLTTTEAVVQPAISVVAKAFTPDAWTSLGGLRMQRTAAGRVHLTRCICACGAIRWLTEAQMQQVPPVPCRGAVHQPPPTQAKATPAPRRLSIDMLHQKVNEWTVTGGPRYRENDPYRLREWLCVCSCGTERWMTGTCLRFTKPLDCGGPTHPAKPPKGGARNLKNMLGQKLGPWTVIGGPRHQQLTYTKVLQWLCRCDCGVERWIIGSNLRSRTPRHRCQPRERISAAKGRADRIDISGQTFHSWTVTGASRSRPLGNQQVTEWLCTCSCGTEAWRNSATLRKGMTRHCRNPVHLKRQVGEKLGEFTILAKDDHWATLRCVCGRLRVFSVMSLSWLPKKRRTCGCNGIDAISVHGDPNLPKDVTGYCQLTMWAGITRQGANLYAKAHGKHQTYLHLAALAEKNHPGEGWRWLKIVPCPPPETTPREATLRDHQREGFLRQLAAIREIQASGLVRHREIAEALTRRGISKARGGPWTPADIAALLRRAATRGLEEGRDMT